MCRGAPAVNRRPGAHPVYLTFEGLRESRTIVDELNEAAGPWRRRRLELEWNKTVAGCHRPLAGRRPETVGLWRMTRADRRRGSIRFERVP